MIGGLLSLCSLVSLRKRNLRKRAIRSNRERQTPKSTSVWFIRNLIICPCRHVRSTTSMMSSKAAITRKIKHAIKQNTSCKTCTTVRQLQWTAAAFISILFQLAANDGVPSSHGRYAVLGCKLKQNANEGCNSCASLALLVLSFTVCFILLVIAP